MGPVITHSFASKQIWPGETWKVYLNAFDPEGEMEAIYCIIDQPGAGSYPASRTRVPKEQKKELSGYLYLNTAGGFGLTYATLVLRVQIQDRAGNVSEPVPFSLAFNPRARQENPPPGVFRDRELGPIMINLGSAGSGP